MPENSDWISCSGCENSRSSGEKPNFDPKPQKTRNDSSYQLYQHYLGVERKQVSQQAKASCETCETTLIAMLQGELDRKSEQLAVKDKQIEELNARLAEVSSALVTAQQTAAAAQALHAGTMHQQLLSGKSGADQPERETEPVQKRSWFSRFFGD